MADSGRIVTHAELDATSNRLAHALRHAGLRRGDHIAILMENNARYFEVVWAALRSGLRITPINWHLAPAEAAYIVEDCEARVLVSSAALADLATAVDTRRLDRRLMVDGVPEAAGAEGWESYEHVIGGCPITPIADESSGITLLYSSGTTGRPKGILKPLPEVPPNELTSEQFDARYPNPWGFDADTIYLSPAPLYHAAPLHFCIRVHVRGGTTVVMDRFDPARALAAIEEFRVTHSQWVPTMFVRMLALPDEQRHRHDLSSHRMAIHAAAPCPVEVKRQLMDWWGPIVHEYYAGSEAFGATRIGPEEWIAHPGSVGVADPDVVFILDENGDELPRGEVGLVHFKPTAAFQYKGDPAKTAGATSPQGHITYGDIGFVDADGYLYLTDRRSFTIISGGVNIYPREIEDVLISHPAVADVGVIGVPNSDLGEEVKAVVELRDAEQPSDELEQELLSYCRERLSHFKCPRSVDFTSELPRLPTGKLKKAVLREPYWAPPSSPR